MNPQQDMYQHPDKPILARAMPSLIEVRTGQRRKSETAAMPAAASAGPAAPASDLSLSAITLTHEAEFQAELRELAEAIAEALGEELVAVILNDSDVRSDDCLLRHSDEDLACNAVSLLLVATSIHPRGMEKLPHLARRYEHRLRLSVEFRPPVTLAMISKWPPRLLWQEIALRHRVLYGPMDILTGRVPRHVLDPLPTIEATRLLLDSGAELIAAACAAAGLDSARDSTLVPRHYFHCAQSIADALLIGCQRFCTDPVRKQAHLQEMARFESIVDQSGALVHLRRALEFRRCPHGGFAITPQHLQEMAQDWQRVYLWVESVRLGLSFENLETYAQWPKQLEEPGTSLFRRMLANLRRRRLGWRHPRERVYRTVAVAISNLAGGSSRFLLNGDVALQQWRESR